MKYYIIEKMLKTEDDISYQSFGVIAKDEKKRILEEIEDLFTDKKTAEECVRMLNNNNVELCHFADVVYDMIVAACTK